MNRPSSRDSIDAVVERVRALPSATVTISPMDPVEETPVVASLFELDGTTPIDMSTVTDVRYTWWAGEGDSPDTITEWELVPPSLAGSRSASFTPDDSVLGQYLRVAVSYVDSDGMFRSATSPVSNTPVAAGPNQAPVGLAVLSNTPVVPGTQMTVQLPTDPDGIPERAT